MTTLLRRHRRAATLVVLGFLVPSPSSAQLGCDPCTVGIALDGPWERNDEILAVFRQEVENLLEGDYEVVFPPEKQLRANWTTEGVRTTVDSLLADPDVDLVLTSGPLTSAHVSRSEQIPKPVVAAFVLDPDIQGIPAAFDADQNRVSGVQNLAYITFPADFVESVTRFREFVPFTRLTLLALDGFVTTEPELLEATVQQVSSLGVELEVVPVGTSIEAALAAIPPDTEAVYVVPLIQLPPGAFDRLVAALIERRLPSFSYWGRSEVDLGLLTSLYLDADFRRLGRRIAVNFQRILLGDDAAAIPVDFERGRRLTINMATARAIGAYPNWSVFTEAELLHREPTDVARTLDLASVAREAVRVNLDLAAAARSVASGVQNVNRARSPLLPQLEVSTGAQFVDADRAAAGFGSFPQRLLAGGATVRQLLYSEPVRANLEIQRQLQLSREQQYEQLRLDIVLEAVTTYLDVLRAKTFERIQRDNLAATRTNLEAAQSRQNIGVARLAELIRWENQLANNRRAVIDASALRSVAEVALNRLLNHPLEERFATADADLEDSSLVTTAARLEPFVNNLVAFGIFRDFMTQQGLERSPELMQLDAAIEAQSRALLATDRAFWTPEVAVEANLTGLLKGGAGSSFKLPADLPFLPSAPGNVNWTVGLNASLPLFTGGARRADRTQAREDLDRLRAERDASADRIEQRVRTALHRAGASFAGIDLAQDAADAASRNLELITDAYRQGTVSILDVLDAQNAQLSAAQVAANAAYDYLADLMVAQRAMGRFDFFLEPGEQQTLLAKLTAFFENAGYQVSGS